MPSNVRLEITAEGMRKNQAVRNLPKAARKQASQWAAGLVKAAKTSAAGMKKSGQGRKTGQLARSVGMAVRSDGLSQEITVGTGISGDKSVIYARIQDQGGTIRAKKKYLTIPMPGILGRASNYPDSFIIRSKAGNPLIVERKGKSGMRVLFVLKREVTLPATNWFSRPLEQLLPDLNAMMGEDAVFATAERLTGMEG
jgi:hypothetical protein